MSKTSGMGMMNYFLLLFISVFLSSCLSSTKYQNMIDFYSDPKKIEVSEDTSIVLKSELSSSRINKIVKTKNLFIPLGLGYGAKTNFDCELNNNYRIKLVSKGIFEKAMEMNLDSILVDREVEIVLKEIPGSYKFSRRSGFLFLGIMVNVMQHNEVFPEQMDLVANYYVRGEGRETISDELRFSNSNRSYPAPEMSTNAFTYSYIQSYQREMINLGRGLLKEIVLLLEEDYEE